MQTSLGLESPVNYSPGLNEAELRECPLFHDIAAPSELHDLFAWRNGPRYPETTSMGKLWIRKGYCLVSAEESVSFNRYALLHFDDWSASWYPLLTNGAAGRVFCDLAKIQNGRLPVFSYDPEDIPETGQMYDNIELMFNTILECYRWGIYSVNSEHVLRSDLRREVEIARSLKPNSDFWWRDNLYSSE